MIRFLLILLLTSVALSQLIPRLAPLKNADANEFALACDEGECEKGGKPDFKYTGEDKLHSNAPAVHDIAVSFSGKIAAGAQQLFISFYDQPNTPPPNHL